MKIGIDIDGVISDFVSGFKKVVYNEYEFNLKEEEVKYHDLDLVLGISKKEAMKLIEKTLNIDLPLIKDAKKYINLLKGDHKIILLTARHINHQLTQKWLNQNNIKYDELYFLNEGGKYKSNINIDVIIEDNLTEALNWTSKINNIIIFDHPWNQSIDIYNNLYRVKNWREIYEYIKKISIKE